MSVKGRPLTWLHKERIGEANRKPKRKLTMTHRANIGAGQKIRYMDESQKEAVRRAKQATWKIRFPDKSEKIIVNLTKFCRDNNISRVALWMTSVIPGRKHKGYRVWKLSK